LLESHDFVVPVVVGWCLIIIIYLLVSYTKGWACKPLILKYNIYFPKGTDNTNTKTTKVPKTDIPESNAKLFVVLDLEGAKEKLV